MTIEDRLTLLEEGFKEVLFAVRGATIPHSVLNKTLSAIEERYVPSAPMIESVYGKPFEQLKPPAGSRFKREHCRNSEGQIMNVLEPVFRIPIGRDAWLRQDGTASECLDGMSEPRLILEKCKRLVFDILDENRPAKPGEWCGDNTCALKVEHFAVRGSPYNLSEPRVEE